MHLPVYSTNNVNGRIESTIYKENENEMHSYNIRYNIFKKKKSLLWHEKKFAKFYEH